MPTFYFLQVHVLARNHIYEVKKEINMKYIQNRRIQINTSKVNIHADC